MIRRFDCPDCGKFLGRTDGSVLETMCKRCRRPVFGVPLDLQYAMECDQCGRRRYYEAPPTRPSVCVICGTDTLIPITAVQRPDEARQPEEVVGARQERSHIQA